MANSKRLKIAKRVSRRVQGWYGKGLDRAREINQAIDEAAKRAGRVEYVDRV